MKKSKHETNKDAGVERGVVCVAAQAYQVIGALTVSDIEPRKGEIKRALDYFSKIANGDIEVDEQFLPWG